MSGLDLPKIDLSTLKAGEELTSSRPLNEDIFQSRIGMITGSNFGKLVVKTKDKKGYTLSNGEVAKKLIYRTVWERLSKEGIISNGIDRMNFNSASTNHGHDYEQEAIEKYIEETGNKVDYRQKFIEYDNYIGGTPDGYIGDDGIIEVKCPWDGGNHIQSLITGDIYNTDYVYQIQGYLWMTGRRWCDFITYDPDIIEALQLNIIRVYRDEEIIEGISSVMDKVKEKIKELMNNEKFKNNGKNNA